MSFSVFREQKLLFETLSYASPETFKNDLAAMPPLLEAGGKAAKSIWLVSTRPSLAAVLCGKAAIFPATDH